MIESLIKSSLGTRLLVFILAIFVAAAGYYAYSNLTIEAFPDPTDTQVQVITIYPGQPSEEVERRVSIPLERALGVVPDDLFQALSKASQNASGGSIERGSELFVIRSLGTFRSLDDVGRVRVGFHGGVPVKVSDVATVTFGYQPRQGVVTRGGNED